MKDLKNNSIVMAIMALVVLMAMQMGVNIAENRNDVSMPGNEMAMGGNSNIYVDDARSVTTTNMGDETALNVSTVSVYSSTTPSYEDGDVVSPGYDANGNQTVSLGTRLDEDNDHVTVYPSNYSYDYEASAVANAVIKTTAGQLHAIIVGKDVSGGIIEVSDHASDGDGNVKVYLEDPNVGTYIVDANFPTGMTADMTTQTNVTFIYK